MRKVGAHIKKFCFAPALCPPPHLQIAFDATACHYVSSFTALSQLYFFVALAFG